VIWTSGQPEEAAMIEEHLGDDPELQPEGEVMPDIDFLVSHIESLRWLATRSGHREVAHLLGVALEAAKEAALIEKLRLPR
jgi:hypothetical protein